MKRAVITGLGIVSCLGNDRESVTHSLRNGISEFNGEKISLRWACAVMSGVLLISTQKIILTEKHYALWATLRPTVT